MPEWFIAAQAEKRTRAALMRRFKQGFGSVYASGCTKLTTLNAGKAGSVDARGCTKLTTLNAGQATGSVYARGCTKLTTLNAGKAGSVDASGCTSNLKIIARKGALIYR